MKRVHTFVERIAASIARKTALFGARVEFDLSVLDRSDSITLSKPGLRSANSSCELIKAKDGWIAANLPRPDDRESVPALIGSHVDGDVWEPLRAHAQITSCDEMVARAELLGLAIAKVGETKRSRPCSVENFPTSAAPRTPLRVVDFSSLWAGPLCGSVFAAMGADVIKIESAERPDTTPRTAPLLNQRLNDAKAKMQSTLSQADSLAALHKEIMRSDVVITSARARALDTLGINKARLFSANPTLIWIAITGHGFDSPRIAFGDDAAASGGLVDWEGDAPRFIGDALADPLTGLAAADLALDALKQGRGAFIDAALARAAAFVATLQA